MSVAIRPLFSSDWEAVRTIYIEGLETRQATFETEAPHWELWDDGHRKDCRLAASENDRLVGWAALSPVSSRMVYGGVAEVSVYVAAEARAPRSASIRSSASGRWACGKGSRASTASGATP